MPTDEELIAEIKAFTPEQRKLLHLASELDDVELEALWILVDGMAAGIPETEAAHKAAEYMTDHERPEAAQQIIEHFSAA